MKTLALIVVLALQSTGLWSHLPESSRSQISAVGAGYRAAGQLPIAHTASLAPIPIQTGSASLHLDSSSAYAIDVATGTVLYAQDPAAKRPIASVTKIITCLVILSRHSVDEQVTVPTLPTYQTADEVMGLVPGEHFRLGDLVTAALVQSANDAAEALAIIDAGSMAKFEVRMNAKMTQWGITGTHFSSPSGLKDEGNYATAEALARIGALALANPTIRDAIKLTTANVTSGAGRTFNFTNTNDLLATGNFMV